MIKAFNHLRNLHSPTHNKVIWKYLKDKALLNLVGKVIQVGVVYQDIFIQQR